MHTHRDTCTCAHVYTCMCTHTAISMHMHAYTHACTYMYTHTQAPLPPLPAPGLSPAGGCSLGFPGPFALLSCPPGPPGVFAMVSAVWQWADVAFTEQASPAGALTPSSALQAAGWVASRDPQPTGPLACSPSAPAHWAHSAPRFLGPCQMPPKAPQPLSGRGVLAAQTSLWETAERPRRRLCSRPH